MFLEHLDLVLDNAEPEVVALLCLDAFGAPGSGADRVVAVRPSHAATRVYLMFLEGLLERAGLGDAQPGVVAAAEYEAAVEAHDGGSLNVGQTVCC